MADTALTSYSGSTLTGIIGSFLGANSGITVDASSIVLSASAPDAINFYDGSLLPLGIGSGLLLTSGTTPGTYNSVDWFGQDNTAYNLDGTPINFYNGDPNIDAVVNSVFQTQSYDATTLSFNFSVTDPNATSISFDLVFGSDEYPEWVDQFVDCAVIIVNGVNYALFNHDPNAPLSVISSNLAAGYFQDNAGNVLPIEYDGVSHVLKIVAPIIPGQVNTIKIGIADTGDHIYDSGMFISNMVAGTTPGSGVVITPDVPCTDGSDTVTGSIKDELINMLGGDDTAYAGGGDDIIVAGAGNDKLYGGSGEDVLQGDQGDDYLDGGEGTANEAVYSGNSSDYSVSYDAVTGKYTITDTKTGATSEGGDTLLNVQLVKFVDGVFDLTTQGLVAHSSGSGGVSNSIGSVVLSGASVVGKTLTAIVLDADGLPTADAINYQWMTSADGSNWVDTGITAKAYTLSEADAGQQLKAVATYTDNHGYQEAPSSAPMTVAIATTGLSIQLMDLAAPDGASVANPLTTLLKNAVDLGFSANEAANSIKAALGLPDISLKNYDAVAALATDPTDPVALQVMKIMAQVAMSASISDPTGFNLTLAVLDAAANNQVINLANATQLATILVGVDSSSLDLVWDLNDNMAQAKDFATIVKTWNDYCGQLDHLKPYLNHLETLSVHINQGPVGESIISLPDGTENVPYVITQSDLLAGFSDPEQGTLFVSALVADKGGTITDNGDGTWTFTPDVGFVGPVELSFVVSDNLDATINGYNMLIIAADPTTPTDVTPPSLTFSSDVTGTTNGDISYLLTFSEAITGLAAGSFTVSHGTVTSVTGAGDSYSVVITPDAGFEGNVELTLNAGAVTDAAGNANAATSAAAQAVDTLAPSATIVDNVTGTANGDVIYTITFSEAVTGLAADDFVITNGAVTAISGSGNSYSVTVTPNAGVEGSLGLALNAGAVSDAVGNGSDAAVAAAQAIDTLAPTVATFSPADGAINVAINANIVVTFSEAIALGTGLIQIRSGSASGTVVESFDASSSARLSISGSVLTIDPTLSLQDGTQYFVTFAAGTLRDIAGNNFAGSASYDFTTAVPAPLNLVGTAGIDTLTGGALNDLLNGLGAVDILDGRDGSDLYLIGAASEHNAAEIKDSGASGTDEVRFTATATGTLTLYAGDTGIEQVVIGTGTGTGAAALTSGTTALNVNASAVLNGLTIIGNAGANSLTGTAFNDMLLGGAGNDVLNGGAGNDTASYQGVNTAVTVNLGVTKAQVTGGAGSDTLSNIENLIGGAANDTLTGNGVANRIDGDAGSDVIVGNAGADSLLGGAGVDKLTGGADADNLWGGAGADSFIYTISLADSAVGARDTIWDFSRSDGDKINLSLIDAISGGKDQAFTLVGTFTNVAGQLISVLEGDHYAVQGDVNGDGVADFAINVHATAALMAADFVL